jgi:hypothetical protein
MPSSVKGSTRGCVQLCKHQVSITRIFKSKRSSALCTPFLHQYIMSKRTDHNHVSMYDNLKLGYNIFTAVPQTVDTGDFTQTRSLVKKSVHRLHEQTMQNKEVDCRMMKAAHKVGVLSKGPKPPKGRRVSKAPEDTKPKLTVNHNTKMMGMTDTKASNQDLAGEVNVDDKQKDIDDGYVAAEEGKKKKKRRRAKKGEIVLVL